MMPETEPQAKLTRLAPALLVRDIAVSLAFYRDRLGFRAHIEGDPPQFAIVARDGCRLFLKRADIPFDARNRRHVNGDWFYDAIFFADGPDSVDALYEEFAAAGVQNMEPPHTEFGMRVFHFFDPDGYKFWVHAMIE